MWLAMNGRPRIAETVLDKHSSIPLYLQLKQHVVHLISSGAWTPGMSLPSVRQLAAELNLATATVQRTYSELEAQGLVVGHTGRGVFVAELQAGVPPETGERTELLNGLLARSVGHARSLGFGEDEIVAAVRHLLDGPRLHGTPLPRVLFVSPHADVGEKYRLLLREALAGVNVAVEAVPLADLEQDAEGTLRQLEPVRCLVSLVAVFPEMRRLVGDLGIPLFALVVDLTEETQHALVSLPDHEQIGLVTEERYIASSRALLRQYRGPDDRLIVVGHKNRAGLRRVLKECRIIVHTFGSTRLLEGKTRPDQELVELKYRPNPSSLGRLRALLQTDHGREARSATAAALVANGKAQ